MLSWRLFMLKINSDQDLGLLQRVNSHVTIKILKLFAILCIYHA
jgi:hypothetical protein